MQFIQHDADDLHLIRSVQHDAVRIGERAWSASLLLTPAEGAREWPVAALEDLGRDTLKPVLEYQPDVLLVGTGRRMRLPGLEVQRMLAEHNIGVEFMALDAAARTFNVLAVEGRRVMLALIWEPGTQG
ncbi:MAG: Mth938-like domain-containing protein [Wenzhouxiangellaceae bacterium]